MPVDQRAIQEQVEAQCRRNAALVETIKSKGGDLGRERTIDVFFHTRTEDTAIKLAGFLKTDGFHDLSITRSETESDHPWTVQGHVTRIIADFTASPSIEWLVGVAARFDLIYDGWGTVLDEATSTI